MNCRYLGSFADILIVRRVMKFWQQVGERILICDAGGGTVVCFLLVHMAKQPLIVVIE